MDRRFQEAVDAIRRGDVEHLRQLVSRALQLLRAVDEEDHPGTLLHIAAAGPHPAVVAGLIQLGAAVDAMTWATPLTLAASHGRTENARLLLAAGATFDARSKLGTTPLAAAVLHGHPGVGDVLAARGVAPPTLWVAAGAGHLPLVKQFLLPDGTLAEGAGLHREDAHNYGMPPRPRSDEPWAIIAEAFQYACANARIAVAQYFLSVGVDINRAANIGSPLHWAAYCGHLDMVKFLVEQGASVSARDDEWDGTPRTWAVQRRHTAVAEFLREREG